VLTNAGSLVSDPENGTERTIAADVQNGTVGSGGHPGTIQVNQPLNIQGNLMNSSGTVAVAHGEHLNLSRNYSQSRAGTLAPQIASDATYGAVHAIGTATLDGTVALTGTYPAVLPQSLAILGADGGRSGTFASADAVVSAADGKYYLPSYSSTAASLSLRQGTLSLSAASGDSGSSVTVSGTNWPPSDAITIAGADSTGATARSAGINTDASGAFATSIQIPANAAPGPARIWVESRSTGGSSRRMGSQPFTVTVPPPTVSGVAPTSGPAAGGTSVTITGAHFANASAVAFGGTPAAGFMYVSDTQITATSPPGSGTVDVTVATPGGTSSTSAADRFSYESPSPLPSPSPPPRPAIAASGAKPSSSTGAGFSGSVNPGGAATVVHFEYGLDTRYRAPGGTTVLYEHSTTDQPVGSGSSDTPVTAAVLGLLPNAVYHVRLVASNSAGTTFGPDQTFTTMADPPPLPPKLGSTEAAKPVGGQVFLLVRGQLVPLTEARQIPSGSELDTRRGVIELTAASGSGTLQKGTFGGAVFKLTQGRAGVGRGLTTLTIVEGAFPGAPSYAGCHQHARDGSLTAGIALAGNVLQTLRARAHGRFRTVGRYSAATVRGTVWDVADRCDGTLTSVHRGIVTVNDLVRHTIVSVAAGHSYLAKAAH
jgi:hypothetical protein